MPYNAFQTMSLCPFVACQEQHLTPSTKNERRLPQWSWEYFGLLTGRDEKCHRKRQISRHSPKIMGTIPQNHGDYPPKSWGLKLPKIKQRKSNKNIRHNWNLHRKKVNTPTIVEGYFALSLKEFFPSMKKNIAHHGTTVLACRQPQSAHNAASAS